jgi:rhodanese-related sulfurtransferase
MHRVRLDPERRWYERLHHDTDYDVWVIAWLPGQDTGYHDHGASAGAFTVVTGALEEHRVGGRPAALSAGGVRSFGADYTHNVRNASGAPAVSIHAYSPPLTEMNEYELSGNALMPVGTSTTEDGWRTDGRRHSPVRAVDTLARRSIVQLLASARDRLHRLAPPAACDTIRGGDGVLVDIRPSEQRALEGEVPGALVVERNVLEWRFDPASAWRLPAASGYDARVIVLCSEGYTSSLAAASLQDLGLHRATDVIGGFRAWREAGLPVSGAATYREE